MKVILMLCVLLVTIPAFAGTFRDNFDDGNCAGWNMGPGIDDKISFVNGVIRIDEFNKPTSAGTGINIIETNWKDYSFSADIRVVQNNQSNNWSGGIIVACFERIDGYENYGFLAAIVNGWVQDAILQSMVQLAPFGVSNCQFRNRK